MIPRFRAATRVAKPKRYFSYVELTAAVAMTSGEDTLRADGYKEEPVYEMADGGAGLSGRPDDQWA